MTSVGGFRLSPSRLQLLERMLRADGIDRAPTPPPVLRREPGALVPLTVSQRRLWFIDQLTGGSAAYVIPAALRVHGDIDANAFVRACEEVVRRHESLRTVFVAQEGQPFQLVRDDLAAEVAVTDLSLTARIDVDEEARRRLAELAGRAFDLRTGPLLRVELMRIGPLESVILVSMHHIVSDQWSMGVLTSELVSLYSDFAAGRESSLPELAMQYPDFAARQQDSSAAQWQAGLAYWMRQLKGAPAEIGLPADRLRPREKTYQGSSVRIDLPAELVARLRAIARSENATMFMVLAAAFTVLLHRLSGDDDIVVGTPVANRRQADLEPLIGFFVNTLALRTDLSGEPEFGELVRRVKQVCLDAYDHQDVPFERLVEELRPERSLARTPVFQVMLAYQNAPLPAWTDGPVRIEPIPADATTAKFDLTLNLIEDGDTIWGRLEFSTDIFDADRARGMARCFQRLLRNLAADPRQRIGAVPMLGAAGRREALALGRGPAVELPAVSGVGELVAARASAHPDAAAVVCSGARWSYAELEARANRLAWYLRGSGAGPQTVVALCLPRGADMIAAILAAWKTGAAYLPLDPDHPAERLAFLLADSRAVALVGRSDDLPGSIRATVWLNDPAVEAAISAMPATTPPPADSRADRLAYVIYTSGSTGSPKGVQITHKGLLSYLTAVPGQTGLGAAGGQYALLQSPVTDLGNTIIFTALVTGGTLHILDPGAATDPAAVAHYLADHRIDYMKVVPSHLAALASGCELNRLLPAKTLVLGGEAAPVQQVEELLAAAGGRTVANHYGPTETTIGVAATRLTPERLAGGTVPIGRPLAGTSLYVLDAYQNPVPPGAAGELYVGGAQVARGYLGREELTAERFLTDPFAADGSLMYRTGDRVRWRSDGLLEFHGRIDHQVKIRGYRIEPGEIEAVLATHPSVARAIVVPWADASGEQRLAAYLVASHELASSGGDGHQPEELAAAAREYAAIRLPAYMVPSAFMVLPALPLTSNGKVDRTALPDPDQARAGLGKPFVAPRNDLELAIAEQCARLLNLDQVGAHDDFFELGGHSLLAIQLSAQIAAAHGVQVPMRDFFENATVAQLAAFVASRAGAGASPAAIEPTDRAGGVPLSFAQEWLCVDHPVAIEDSYHNVTTTLVLTGRLDDAALRRSLDDIASRHEPLRTRIARRPSGEWVQVVEATGSWPLGAADLSALDEQARRSELGRLVREAGHRGFRLGCEPPVGGTLIKTAGDERVLVLVMHHLVTDNWSYGVLIGDLCELYQARQLGRPPRLPELSVQYADYAAWQRRQLASGALEADAAYWRRQLAGLPATPRFAAPEYQLADPATGHTQAFVLDAATARGLAGVAQQTGTTLFMVLLAAYAVLLSAYCGSDDVVISFPEAGRERPETEHLIGFFVNHLLVRTDLSSGPAFRQFVGQVRDKVLDAYRHQGFPLLHASGPRTTGRDPFRLVFNLLNAPIPAVDLHGVRATPLEAAGSYVFAEVAGNIESAQVDLGLIIRQDDAGLRGMWLYSLEHIDARVMAVLMGRWEHLINLVVANPDNDVTELRNRLRQATMASGDDRSGAGG